MDDFLDSKHWHKVSYTVRERKADFDKPVVCYAPGHPANIRPEFRGLPKLVGGIRPPKSVRSFDNIKQLFGEG